MKIYIVLKDESGVLRPKAYMESKEVHLYQKPPKLQEGESLVEVKLVEVEKDLKAI